MSAQAEDDRWKEGNEAKTRTARCQGHAGTISGNLYRYDVQIGTTWSVKAVATAVLPQSCVQHGPQYQKLVSGEAAQQTAETSGHPPPKVAKEIPCIPLND